MFYSLVSYIVVNIGRVDCKFPFTKYRVMVGMFESTYMNVA